MIELAEKWRIIESSKSDDLNKVNFLIDKASDISELPEWAAPGSAAFTADMSFVARRSWTARGRRWWTGRDTRTWT
jgi:hypothetical protein